jgi:hypothetical protein
MYGSEDEETAFNQMVNRMLASEAPAYDQSGDMACFSVPTSQPGNMLVFTEPQH